MSKWKLPSRPASSYELPASFCREEEEAENETEEVEEEEEEEEAEEEENEEDEESNPFQPRLS